MEAFDSKISRQDKRKHSKMGEKHVIKIVKLLWRVSTKIMQHSEQQALNRFSTRKGDIFWLYHAKLILVYLYSMWLYLCSSSSKCSDTNRMPCKTR